MHAPAPPATPGLACTRCGGALQVLGLAGHYGRSVEIDLCPPCHLVWFDSIEAARLAGPGLLELVGAMAAAQTLPHHMGQGAPACPRCRGPVRAVHNQTRWGRSLHLECRQGHGAWQTFAQFLSEKGLLRPLAAADRQRVLQRDGRLHCVNCGGSLAADEARCSWCGSVPALVDVARLARALDPEDATAGHAAHAARARTTALQCAACGAAQPDAARWQCAACGATLAATGLAEAHQAVQTMADALRAHAAKPAPHVVQQRLAALEPGLQRERERTARWQAEAEQRRTGRSWPGEASHRPGDARGDWWRRLLGQGNSPLGVLLSALLWWLRRRG